MQKPAETNRGVSGSWALQAFSGILVVALLALHMIAQHFVAAGGLRSYEEVLQYISNPLIIVLELLFLVVVTYHALMGVRAIIIDLGISDRQQATVNRALTVLGAVMVVWGLILTFTLVNQA